MQVKPDQSASVADAQSASDGAAFVAAVAGSGTRQLSIVGATYAFSKHTNLYAEFDVNRYDGALIPASKQTSQRGVSMGLNHLF